MNKRVLLILICVCMPLTGITLADTTGDKSIDSNTVLTENHNGKITITADHVTLDCAGFEISSTFLSVIEINNHTGVTVKNCNVAVRRGFVTGIRIRDSNHIRIVDNNFINTYNRSHVNAIWVEDSEKLSIVNNVSTNDSGAFALIRVSDSFIEGNTISDITNPAFIIEDSHDNRFVNNIATDNSLGFVFRGDNFNNNFKSNISCGNSHSNLFFGNGDESLDNNLRNNDFLPGNDPCP